MTTARSGRSEHGLILVLNCGSFSIKGAKAGVTYRLNDGRMIYVPEVAPNRSADET